MIAAGLDMSLTSTGWAYIDTIEGVLRSGSIPTDPKSFPVMELRLDHIMRRIPWNNGWGADLVCIEDLAHGAIGSRKAETAALHWMARVHSRRRGVWSVPVNVAHVKEYATGRGVRHKVDGEWVPAPQKPEMVAALGKRLGDRVPEIRTDDEADACWLAMIAADRLGQPLVEMPKGHRAVLGKIAWPELISDKEEVA